MKKLTYSFCKLDLLFIANQEILYMLMKWHSLQKVCVNLCENSFMRLSDAWVQIN